MSNRKFLKVLLIFSGLLLIRFYISLLFFNADFYNHNAWVNYMKDFGTRDLYSHDFTPWAKANYPPLANILFLGLDRLYSLFFLSSEAMLSSFYKLVSIIPETALITYFLYKKRRLEAVIIFFNPGIFYNTLFWGQTEGAISSFTALSLISFLSSYTLFGFIFFATALLIKQSALVFLPVVAVLIYKTVSLKKIILASIITFIYMLIAFLPFTSNILIDPFVFFLKESGGQAHQHLATVNAFNFWFLIGQNNVPDAGTYLGISFRIWGYLLIIPILIPIILKFFRQKFTTKSEAFTVTAIIMLSTFLFTTRMHERHFFPSLILLLPFAVSSKKNFLIYSFLSCYHFLNLYWVWGYPNLPLSFFLMPSIVNSMIVVSIISFVIVYVYYLKHDYSRN
jgi:dolichyl-phosphate-mannose-protein mannosyltransferase